MDYHQNARLTIHSREQMAKMIVEQGVSCKLAATTHHVSAKTAAKWARRYRERGCDGLEDLSSRPHSCPRQLSSTLLEKVFALRRQRKNGWHIAKELGISRATVSRALRRAGMNHLQSLDPPPAFTRYEHKHPGDMIHFDIKQLASIREPGHRVTNDPSKRSRGAGYEYLHIAIDDHSRISFAAILPDQTQESALLFFFMARAHFNRFGFGIKRVYSDNGPCYHSDLYRDTMHRLHIKQRYTRPYTPRTNGKAERFIQTALREWAHGRTYQNSREREEQLVLWLHDYNFHRPHASLNKNTPASRAGLNRNNLLRLHT
jgi:transposase InsO family protein